VADAFGTVFVLEAGLFVVAALMAARTMERGVAPRKMYMVPGE
jgi:MFS transporter, BCD family, chlorophyll transporter